MADLIITPDSGLIDFQNTSGISSAKIQLDSGGDLILSSSSGDIQIGDTSTDIIIGDGVANVDIIFEEDGEIRGITGKTITLGQSDSFITFAGDITGSTDFTGNVNITGVVTATSFFGDGSNLTGITAGGVGAITGVTIREEGSVVGSAGSIGDINFVSSNLTATASGVGATITLTDDPNFNGVNVTGVVTATTFSGNLPTTDLTGTITNAQLAGSITNAKLVNDSVSYGGVSLDLGQTDATPAFDLSDATNYPYTSLTGVTTSIIGDTTPQLGGDLDVNGNDITGTGNINLTGVVTATSFVGDGSGLTGIAAGFAGVTIREEGSVVGSASSVGDINFVSGNLTASASGVGATITLTDDPNFNGVNVTGVVTATTFSGNLPTTDLTGTITNAQLAGSITNAKLVNDSVSFGGVSLDLGQTDATPAFDLSDATNYPYTSLTGVTTSIIGDTTPQLGGDLDVNGNDITGTGNINLTGVVTATSFFGDGSGLTGVGGDTATANQIVFKDSSNVATGSTSLTYSGTTSSGVGTVGIGTIIKNIHYDNLNDGTLSWEASEGQLFSITNNLTSGSIFSVNDVSGFPSIDVDADGTIQLAPISTIEYVGIGTTNPTAKLHVVGDVLVSGVVTATSFVGDGSLLTNLPAGDSGGSGTFDTGITTSIYVSVGSGIGTASVEANNDIFIGPGIAYSFPATAGKSYVIESIQVTNIYNTHLYFTSRHDFDGGENVPTSQRVIIPYQGALELLDQPIIANPSDILNFQAFAGVGTEATGINNGLDSFIVYSEKTDTDYIGTGATIVTTAGTELFTSTTNPSVLQSIRLCNYDLILDVDASVSIYRGGSVGGILTTGVRQGYLVYNLTIPKNSVVEILEKSKYLATNDTIVVGVAGTNTANSLSATLSGKYIV